MSEKKQSNDLWGALMGVVVFLVGLAILGWVFQQAAQMFRVPPALALGMEGDKPADLNKVGDNVFALIARILLLLVMCVVGSLVASRGIKLYEASRTRPKPSE